jgi:hypothetical protein
MSGQSEPVVGQGRERGVVMSVVGHHERDGRTGVDKVGWADSGGE